MSGVNLFKKMQRYLRIMSPLNELAVPVITAALCLSWFGVDSVATEISGYHYCSYPMVSPKGREYRVIREYLKEGDPWVLTVDLDTWTVNEIRRVDLRDWHGVSVNSGVTTSFETVLNRSTTTPAPIQNAGLRHMAGADVFLTMDLCPSTRPLDREFLTWLLTTTAKRPIPVGFSISGEWLRTHDLDFKWLLNEQKRGHFDITWINHSYSHPYDKTKAITHTFLRTNGICFEDEVFKVEQMLLERGCVPSVFFRFPGLVSSDVLLGQLREWSLIPLGSDAWIAKGEYPIPGSVVLLHANGNEPKGLAMFKARRFPRVLRAQNVGFFPLHGK
jgi:hypothetical protein